MPGSIVGRHTCVSAKEMFKETLSTCFRPHEPSHEPTGKFTLLVLRMPYCMHDVCHVEIINVIR